ncbi:MAG: helix-turn-helix domain-containing protein [Pseudomonadota bacterium]|nr:helix-turn-helix domain-containing protein [Pseudomonadota bacterium]
MSDQRRRTTVVEHASELGAWRMHFLAPTDRQAPFVRRFNAYAEENTGFARRRELPSGLATLVFNLGQELRVEHPVGVRTAYPGGTGFYTGPSSTYAVTETDRAQAGAQIMLTPLGARRLLGLPLAEVSDQMIDPIDLFGGAAREVIERLQGANSHSRRLAILEQEVERRLAAATEVAGDLAWATQRLQATSGRIGVGALAAELGCSRKHLTVRFRRELGVSPKRLARVLRFARATRLLGRDRIASWAKLADICGYADQAHLTREFREFAGSPPTAFLRRVLPDAGGVVD